MGHSFFIATNRITLLFIVQFLLHRNPLKIWFKFIMICDPDRVFTRDKKFSILDNFAPCKRDNRQWIRVMMTCEQHGRNGRLLTLAFCDC